MNIEQTKHGAVTVLKPVGAVAKADAEQLRDRLLQARTQSLGRVVLDLSGIPFMDSLGLEVLASMSEQMTRGGQALKVCAPNETLREVLDLTDIAGSLDLYDEMNTAVRSFI